MHRLIIIIAFFTVSLLMASEPYPGHPRYQYSSELWAPPVYSNEFYTEKVPIDSINITWNVIGSLIGRGYPYHYGAVWGVNDTVLIKVYFDNNSYSDMSFIGLQPQDWFYPVLYDPNVDVFNATPLADTNAFRYRFEHWINLFNEAPTVRPDTLRSYKVHETTVHPRGLILSLWGLYPGRYRAVLFPTVTKPSNVNLVMSSPYNDFKIVNGNSVKDTLNAFVSIAERASSRLDWTLHDLYVDSIFMLNSKAVPGWILRCGKYIAVGDTFNAEMATDSILYILENYKDPMLPDSTNMDEVNRLWILDNISLFKYVRWCLRNPEEAKNIFPM